MWGESQSALVLSTCAFRYPRKQMTGSAIECDSLSQNGRYVASLICQKPEPREVKPGANDADERLQNMGRDLRLCPLRTDVCLPLINLRARVRTASISCIRLMSDVRPRTTQECEVRGTRYSACTRQMRMHRQPVPQSLYEVLGALYKCGVRGSDSYWKPAPRPCRASKLGNIQVSDSKR